MAHHPSTIRKHRPGAPNLSVVGDVPEAPLLSFDGVFERFAPYVAQISLRLLGNDTDTDDMVQEVFFDCSRKIGRIRDWDHARRWLAMVTVRKARRLLRRRKLLCYVNLPLSRKLDPPMPSASADDRAAVIQIFTILERLPVNQRLAWSLRHLEGAELKEVAEACGCSVATAKRWIGAAQRAVTGGDHG